MLITETSLTYQHQSPKSPTVSAGGTMKARCCGWAGPPPAAQNYGRWLGDGREIEDLNYKERHRPFLLLLRAQQKSGPRKTGEVNKVFLWKPSLSLSTLVSSLGGLPCASLSGLSYQ